MSDTDDIMVQLDADTHIELDRIVCVFEASGDVHVQHRTKQEKIVTHVIESGPLSPMILRLLTDCDNQGEPNELDS